MHCGLYNYDQLLWQWSNFKLERACYILMWGLYDMDINIDVSFDQLSRLRNASWFIQVWESGTSSF